MSAGTAVCAEHLAKLYHARATLLGVEMHMLDPYSWDDVSGPEQKLITRAMQSLLDSGALVCTHEGHAP